MARRGLNDSLEIPNGGSIKIGFAARFEHWDCTSYRETTNYPRIRVDPKSSSDCRIRQMPEDQ